MPQVPYQPIPDVAPANVPSPKLAVQTHPAAFGVGIAESIERLGGTADKVGTELFDRAYAMQQLKNETESSQAISEYEKQAGLLHANYSNLQGLNAVNAFPKYQTDLEDKKTEIRNGLSNPMAQKMYDRTANSIQGRSIFNGAGHAGQQNKVAAHGEAQARIDATADSILRNPNDEVAFRDGLNTVAQQTRVQADLGGMDEAATARAISLNQSKVITARITGVNRTDPEKAKTLREQYKDQLQSTDMAHLDPRIQQQTRIVGSRNVSDSVNAGWAPYMTAGQVQTMAGVQEPLQRILQQAQRDNPDLRILPTSGFRTTAEQAEIRARHEAMPGGVAAHPAARPGESYHESGRAIDVVPGVGTTYEQIDAAMKAASQKLGIPFSPEHDRLGASDPGHFSIPHDYDVSTAPKAVPESEESRIKRAEDYARRQYPEDPLMVDAVRDRTRNDFAHIQQVNRDALNRNTEIIQQGIQGPPGGRPPRNIDELTADPQVRAAYDALPPDKQNKTQRDINAYNRSMAEQTDDKFMTRLQGMAETDRDQFLQIDAYDPKLPLSRQSRDKIVSMQRQKRKDPSTSIHIQQAHAILDHQLQGLQITKKDNEEQYHEFWGAMDDALNYETLRTGKPPDFNKIKEIGNRLLYTVQPSSWLNWTSEAKAFEIAKTASEAEREAAKAKMLQADPYADISDRGVNRELARAYYIKNFGGASKPK